MILFKKWAKHIVIYISSIYWGNQFLHEERHKKWNQECKQKQSLLFNFCNIFDLLNSRTQKIAWWPLVLKPDFYRFSTQENLKKFHRQVFIVSYLLKRISSESKNRKETNKRIISCTRASKEFEAKLDAEIMRLYKAILRYFPANIKMQLVIF